MNISIVSALVPAFAISSWLFLAVPSGASKLPATDPEAWTSIQAGPTSVLALAKSDQVTSLAEELTGRIGAFDAVVGIGELSNNLLLVWFEDPANCVEFGLASASAFTQLTIPADRLGRAMGGAVWVGCGSLDTVAEQLAQAANRWQVTNRVAAFPRFLQLGLIELLDQIELENNQLAVALSSENLELLRSASGPWMSFERASHIPWDVVVPAERPILAAQAWAFVHYFLMGPAERAESLREAHRLATLGASFPIAFLEATGSLLDVRTPTVKRYASKKKIESVDSVRAIEVPALIRMTPERDHLLIELARMWTALEQVEWAADAFAEAEAEAAGRVAQAAAGSGFSARAQADHERAEDAFLRASSLDPTNPDWSLEAARSLLVRSGGEATTEQQLAAARAIQLLRASADLDRGRTQTWSQLAVAIERAESLDSEVEAWLEGHYHVAGDRRGDIAVPLFTLYSRGPDQREEAMALVAQHQELRHLPTFSDAGLVEVGEDISLETAMRWVQEERYAEALVALESLRSRGQAQGLDQQLTGEIERLREVVAHNTYVASYNEAAKLFNEQQFRSAADILEPMLSRVEDPVRRTKIEKLLAESLEWAAKTGQ